MPHDDSRFHIRAPDQEGSYTVGYSDLFSPPILENSDAAFSSQDHDPSTPTQAEAKDAGRRKARRLILQYRMHPHSLFEGVFEGLCQGQKEAARRGGRRE